MKLSLALCASQVAAVQICSDAATGDGGDTANAAKMDVRTRGGGAAGPAGIHQNHDGCNNIAAAAAAEHSNSGTVNNANAATMDSDSNSMEAGWTPSNWMNLEQLEKSVELAETREIRESMSFDRTALTDNTKWCKEVAKRLIDHFELLMGISKSKTLVERIKKVMRAQGLHDNQQKIINSKIDQVMPFLQMMGKNPNRDECAQMLSLSDWNVDRAVNTIFQDN